MYLNPTLASSLQTRPEKANILQEDLLQLLLGMFSVKLLIFFMVAGKHLLLEVTVQMSILLHTDSIQVVRGLQVTCLEGWSPLKIQTIKLLVSSQNKSNASVTCIVKFHKCLFSNQNHTVTSKVIYLYSVVYINYHIHNTYIYIYIYIYMRATVCVVYVTMYKCLKY